MINAKINMKDIPQLIGYEIYAQAIKATTTVPIIAGEPGIGKSAILKDLADQMNLNFFIRSIGAMPYEWFSGLPEFEDIQINKDWHEYGMVQSKATSWTISDLIKSINQYTELSIQQGKKGLMVILDDFHLADQITQKYLFEFLQNKTLQNFKLHPQAYLVGAMNNSEADGAEVLFRAVLDRIALYNVEFDLDFWYSKVGHTLHPAIASFIKHEANLKYIKN